MYEKEKDNEVQKINLFKYLLLLTILTLLALFVFDSIELFSDYKQLIIGFTLVFVIPSLYVVYKFVKDNNRIPNKLEKRKFILCSILNGWLVFMISMLLTIYHYDGTAEEYYLNSVAYTFSITVSVISFILTITFISFIMFVLYYICYGWVGKLLIKKQYKS